MTSISHARKHPGAQRPYLMLRSLSKNVMRAVNTAIAKKKAKLMTKIVSRESVLKNFACSMRAEKGRKSPLRTTKAWLMQSCRELHHT